MDGSGITAVTAALAPRPGARGNGIGQARGAGEQPIHTPPAAAAGDGADVRAGAILARPGLGLEAVRALALPPVRDTASSGGLSADEREVVRQMAARDREVLRHEQAHVRAGGPHAGSASFTYQTGPDGKRYAVSGEVPIDAAPVRDDPKATIAKMVIVKAAALAPAKPSMPDRRIAAQAEATRLAAIAELAASRGGAMGELADGLELTGLLFHRLAGQEPGGEVSRAV